MLNADDAAPVLGRLPYACASMSLSALRVRRDCNTGASALFTIGDEFNSPMHVVNFMAMQRDSALGAGRRRRQAVVDPRTVQMCPKRHENQIR